MTCRMCQGEDVTLYRMPVSKQLGSVPLLAACFFCYLKPTGDRPPPAEIVPARAGNDRLLY